MWNNLMEIFPDDEFVLMDTMMNSVIQGCMSASFPDPVVSFLG